MTLDGFCPDCGFFQAHGASCPSRLRTPKQRVERAAHLFAVISNPETARLRCLRDSISEAEQHQGRALAEARRRERAEMVRYLGDSSYGGWTQVVPTQVASSESVLPDELPMSETGAGRSEVKLTMATAAAASNPRTPREVVEFPNNVPVTVALKYGHAKTVSSQYGERFMFTLADGRVMFLAPEVGSKIEALGINVRENFTITRKWDEEKSATTWEVARVAGEQPNGTLVLPLAETNGSAVAPKPLASTPASVGPDHRNSASALLIDETNALVDAYAQILERTLNTYQGRIKPEEARSLLVTAYIQRSKLSFAA